MVAIFHDPHYTFRFGDDRVFPRFHLEGIEVGRRVTVFIFDAANHHRQVLITAGTVGVGGWVDVPESILVRAGEGFVVVPEGPR